MDIHRTLWNQNHQILQARLNNRKREAQDFAETRQLLLMHHAMVHSSSMIHDSAVQEDDIAAPQPVWSFEDEIWQGMEAETVRHIPAGQEHSILWVIWHIARVEDVTMNLLVADCAPVLEAGNWMARLNAPIQDTGNAITDENMRQLNDTVDISALRAYRQSVGQRTRAIIRDLSLDRLPQQVDPVRIQRLRDSGAVVEAASEITDYWSKRTIAGLLMMPATRHNFVHLNEALRIRQGLRK